MAYEPRPGTGSLFQNDRKEKDTHPDYKGDFVTDSGEVIRFAGWKKQTRDGKPFLSLKQDRPRDDRADFTAKVREQFPGAQVLDDEIPF